MLSWRIIRYVIRMLLTWVRYENNWLTWCRTKHYREHWIKVLPLLNLLLEVSFFFQVWFYRRPLQQVVPGEPCYRNIRSDNLKWYCCAAHCCLLCEMILKKIIICFSITCDRIWGVVGKACRFLFWSCLFREGGAKLHNNGVVGQRSYQV